MALTVTIVQTSGASVTEVPEDVAEVLAETYAALKDLPNNRAGTIDFDTDKEARLFVKQGHSWAAANNLEFSRRGTVKDNPSRVIFRIYEKTEGETRGRPKGSKNGKGAEK